MRLECAKPCAFVRVFLRSVFALTLAALCGTAAASNNYWVHRWHQAVERVAALPHFEGVPVDIRWRHAQAEDALLRTRINRLSRCELIVSAPKNPHVAIARHMQPAHQQVLLEALVFRELTACWRWHENPAEYEGWLTKMSIAAPNTRLAREVADRYAMEEAFSDVATLAWVEKAHPRAYPATVAWWQAWRQEPGQGLANHYSQRALARIEVHGMIQTRSPFDAAYNTLQHMSARGRTEHTQAASGKPAPNRGVVDTRIRF